MPTEGTKAVYDLAQNDVYQSRFSALILSALVHKGLLTNSQARALIEDVLDKMPSDLAFRQVFVELKKEFP